MTFRLWRCFILICNANVNQAYSKICNPLKTCIVLHMYSAFYTMQCSTAQWPICSVAMSGIVAMAIHWNVAFSLQCNEALWLICNVALSVNCSSANSVAYLLGSGCGISSPQSLTNSTSPPSS